MKKKVLIIAALFAAIALLCACNKPWFDDGQSDNPEYRTDENGTQLTFLLELREPGESSKREEWDSFSHAGLDGSLIAYWEIPCYGDTVYESMVKYFATSEDSFTFRLSQHKFYMVHDCTLEDGSYYNLETVYIAVDGKYSDCVNYQTLYGQDKIWGTEDDVKVVTLVYRGWLY